LDAAGGTVSLYDIDGITRVDTLTYGAQTSDVSYGRYPNGTGDWQSMTTVTPGAANVAAALTVNVVSASVSEYAGAAATTVTITRNTDSAFALTVDLSSSDTTEATVPTTDTVPAGQSSVTVDLAAVDDAIVDGTQTVTITASATGFTNGSDTLQVTDDDTATLSIVVGDWLIPAGQTAWRIPISVTGGAGVDGINFNIQIEDGSKSPGVAAPVITALDILNGTIFDGKNTGSWDNTIADWIAWDWTETDTGETGYAEGVIGYLTINTVGCPSGTWDLIMSDTLNGPTDFAGLSATVLDGSITVNQRPVADAGGPYSVAEGGAVPLDGSDSLDPDPADSRVSYEWDLDGDGVFGATGGAAGRGDETGFSPTFSAAGLDGPGTWTVSLRVRDNNGLESDASEVEIGISNVPPVIALSGAGAVDEGSPYTVTLGAVTDPGSDTVSQWIVHWGDGSTSTYASGGDKTHVYADDNPTGTPSDPYTITVDLADEDGTHVAAASKTITVRNVAPTVSIGGAPASSPQDVPIGLWAEVTDPAAADTFTYAWTVIKDGSPLASGTASTFTFTPDAAGSYEVTLTVEDDDGGVRSDTRSIRVTEGEVVGRHIFYDRSTFDGNDAAANEQDDLAIASPPTVGGHGHPAVLDEPEKELGKRALLPGETATFVNYTSYLLGINGIMVDIANPTKPEGLDASDFEFRVGNDNDPVGWQEAPAPAGIAVRPIDEDGDGAADFYRVTILWEDYCTYNPDLPGSWKYEINPHGIGNQWLQVRVLATEDTGIPADDVFYFGNAIGETGNTYGTASPNTFVNATDAVGVRHHPHNFVNPAPASDPYDFNRDGRVDASDAVIVRYNPANFLNALQLITAPDSASGGADALRIAWAVPGASAAPLLTQAELAPVLQAAILRMEPAVSPESAAALCDVTVEIVGLPGDLLGREVGGRLIQIDRDAAGYGWFVDATPRNDTEFAVRPGTRDLTARPSSPAWDQVDLLTAVMHELGHVLGHGHDDTGAMAKTLPPGTRRLWEDDLAWFEDEIARDLPGQADFADAVDAVFAGER